MFFPFSCWKSCFLVSLINIDEQRIGRKIQDLKNLIVYRNRYIDISGTENTNVSSWDTNFLCKCFLCETGTIKFLSQKRVTQTGFRNRPSFHLNHSWNNRIQTGNKIPILHPFLVYIMKKKIKKPAIMQGWKIKDIRPPRGKTLHSNGCIGTEVYRSNTWSVAFRPSGSHFQAFQNQIHVKADYSSPIK